MIVATAGHVDHGKTSIIKQITGIDTDRLAEEKKRGLSINLGYAFQQVSDGCVIGFIDVPGHRRFINTMIAGVSCIDLALIVVAADDGVMPQTVEHIEVLRLLGIRSYVLAVTKTDRVPEHRASEVATQILELLEESCPVFLVDNINARGIIPLKDYLSLKAKTHQAKSDSGYFRLSIDRSFKLKGIGCVVTGTVISGSISEGDPLQLMPKELSVKVRSIHAQDKKATIGRAGQRCAFNLVGIDNAKIDRGDWLTAKEIALVTDRCDAKLTISSSIKFPIKHFARVKLYLGAKRESANLYIIERGKVGNQLKAGDEIFVQIIVSEKIVCHCGDAFILRDDSESILLGGGVILNPLAEKVKRNDATLIRHLQVLESGSPASYLRHKLVEEGGLLNLNKFRSLWNMRDDETQTLIGSTFNNDESTQILVQFEDYLVSKKTCDKVDRSIIDFLRIWHDSNPSKEGVDSDTVMTQLRTQYELELIDNRFSDLVREGMIKRKSGKVSLSTFKPTSEITQDKLEHLVEAYIRDYGVKIVSLSDLKADEALSHRDLELALWSLVKKDRLHAFGKRRFVSNETLSNLAQSISSLSARVPKFSVVDVKKHIGIGRNLTVELLEYFDVIRFTLRKGNYRTVIDHALPAKLLNIKHDTEE